MNKTREREQRILAFMKNEIHAKGYPPTVREICNALEIKSTSTVHKDIANLEKQGFLKKDPSKPRALMLVENEEPERKVVSSAPAAYGLKSNSLTLGRNLLLIILQNKVHSRRDR